MRTDFGIFIMVHGRPEKMWTAPAFRRAGYTGKIFYVADNLDETMPEYKKKYGEKLLVFDKIEASKHMDQGDNFPDYRSTLYSANTIFDLAKQQNLKYFMIACDDYHTIAYKFNTKKQFEHVRIVYPTELDQVLEATIDFFEKTPALTIAYAQAGDFIGGDGGKNSSARIQMKRKAMNSFICSTDRPFKFMGKLNEDVTTYVNLGSRGNLFGTITNVNIQQKQHQAEQKGLTEVYKDYGTYVKSFYSVMYNPSSVKIAMMGKNDKRIHHQVKWNNAVPKIIRENHKK